MRRILSAALVLLSSTVIAQPAAKARVQTPPGPRIRAEEIDGHLRFLSSDLLEGRAPGTRGGLPNSVGSTWPTWNADAEFRRAPK